MAFPSNPLFVSRRDGVWALKTAHAEMQPYNLLGKAHIDVWEAGKASTGINTGSLFLSHYKGTEALETM